MHALTLHERAIVWLGEHAPQSAVLAHQRPPAARGPQLRRGLHPGVAKRRGRAPAPLLLLVVVEHVVGGGGGGHRCCAGVGVGRRAGRATRLRYHASHGLVLLLLLLLLLLAEVLGMLLLLLLLGLGGWRRMHHRRLVVVVVLLLLLVVQRLRVRPLLLEPRARGGVRGHHPRRLCLLLLLLLAGLRRGGSLLHCPPNEQELALEKLHVLLARGCHAPHRMLQQGGGGRRVSEGVGAGGRFGAP